MDLSEYKNLLKDQLDTLKQAQKEAFDEGFYSDVAEISKQINLIGLRLVQCKIEVQKNESC